MLGGLWVGGGSGWLLAWQWFWVAGGLVVVLGGRWMVGGSRRLVIRCCVSVTSITLLMFDVVYNVGE